MPVTCGVELTVVDQDQFHALDKIVMHYAFAIHNELGRFCHEAVYQEELMRRCCGGLEVQKEVLLQVSHKGFSKDYYLDLLISRGVVYELKTVETLNKQHQNQLINYLLLSELKHGKLVNFRTDKVESRFVSTTLSMKDRLDYSLNDDSRLTESL